MIVIQENFASSTSRIPTTLNTGPSQHTSLCTAQFPWEATGRCLGKTLDFYLLQRNDVVMFRKCLQLPPSVVWKNTYFWLVLDGTVGMIQLNPGMAHHCTWLLVPLVAICCYAASNQRRESYLAGVDSETNICGRIKLLYPP